MELVTTSEPPTRLLRLQYNYIPPSFQLFRQRCICYIVVSLHRVQDLLRDLRWRRIQHVRWYKFRAPSREQQSVVVGHPDCVQRADITNMSGRY